MRRRLVAMHAPAYPPTRRRRTSSTHVRAFMGGGVRAAPASTPSTGLWQRQHTSSFALAWFPFLTLTPVPPIIRTYAPYPRVPNPFDPILLRPKLTRDYPVNDALSLMLPAL